jgi:hypothetical protein
MRSSAGADRLHYDPPNGRSGGNMIWGLALISLVAFLLAFASHSPGWMGLGIFIGFVSGIAAALLFIERHVRASSRPEHMTEREIQALRGTVDKKDDEATRKLPPAPPH